MDQTKTAKTIREAALDLRSKLGLGDRLAPDMQEVLRKLPELKIKVEVVPHTKTPLADAWTNSRRLFVTESVVKALSYGDTRARWTIAHELAHVVLGHKGKQFRAAPGTPLRWPSGMEREANIFASEFLAPSHLIKGKTADKISRFFGISPQAASIRISELVSADEVPLSPAARARPDIVGELARHGYSEDELTQLVVPKRTLARRRAGKELLTIEETDKALRLKRIATLAEGIFGDRAKANHWLRKAKRGLAGETPLAYLASEHGARVVEEMLRRIEHGIYA